MGLLAKDLIISGTLIRSFRHLKHQNLSAGDDFIYSSRIFFLVPYVAIREAVAPPTDDPIMLGRSIWPFRHIEPQNQSVIEIIVSELAYHSKPQFPKNNLYFT